MSRILVLICCISAVIASPVPDFERAGQPRIIGGKKIKIENTPYQVSILQFVDEERVRGAHMCGGSIISKNYILTAGHCAALEPDMYRVRSGSTSWMKGGKLHKVVEVIRHEDYNEDEFSRSHNDIAIMKVWPDFKLDGKTEKIADLVDEDYEVRAGDDAYVSGWGLTLNRTIGAPENLMGLDVKIMDFEKCSEDYDHFGDMPENNICAEHPSRLRDICNGDSGGPLVIKGKQVGIVSWGGPGCAIPGRPGVYVDVAKYRGWIDKHLEA